MKKEEFDEIVGTVEIKGTTYQLFQGKRGGKYYMKDNKKVYYKEKVDKPKKVSSDEPKRYYVNIRKVVSFEYVNDWTEWVEAYSSDEAIRLVKDEHPDNPLKLIKYEFTLVG